MNRGLFIAAIGGLLLAGWAPHVKSADDPSAVRRALKDYYAAFSGMDKQRYRTLVTEDYLLLENGTILDFAGDVAGMPSPALHPQRKDTFDFRSVKIQGDMAYAVYLLSSDTKDDKNGVRSRRWLESAVLRRSDNGWRVALLHSTKITKPAAG